MAKPARVIPLRARQNPTAVARAKRRRAKLDPQTLSDLEREERQFRERRKAAKANSKPMRVQVPGPVYVVLLRLCEKFGREPAEQAVLCLELGTRFFEQDNTPYGGPRPLDHLPELRAGDILESGDAPVHIAGSDRPDTGWLGKDLGMPEAPYRLWEQPTTQVAVETPTTPLEHQTAGAQDAPGEDEGEPSPPAEEPAFEVEVPS